MLCKPIVQVICHPMKPESGRESDESELLINRRTQKVRKV